MGRGSTTHSSLIPSPLDIAHMSGSRPFESYRSTNTAVNALVGGVVSILVAFIPFSPLVGGFVAGYLQDANRDAALRVGALAGLVALVPALFLGAFVLLFVVGSIAYGVPRAGFAFLLVVLVAAVVSLLYTVGLSAAGGYLGAVVAEDYA
jgi:hypothetical protein